MWAPAARSPPRSIREMWRFRWRSQSAAPTPPQGSASGPLGTAVTTMIGTGETPTFAVFVQGLGNVPFVPAVNRVFVRFNDAAVGVSRGATSVAIRTL